MLDHIKINIALIEGFFDKSQYGYKLYKKEKFIGICSKEHKFADKNIKLSDIFSQTLICREEGSGTREVLKQLLNQYNYSIDSFNNIIDISSIELIKQFVKNNCGISFVYEAVLNSDDELSAFYIESNDIYREFNYVFLKNTNADNIISLFE